MIIAPPNSPPTTLYAQLTMTRNTSTLTTSHVVRPNRMQVKDVNDKKSNFVVYRLSTMVTNSIENEALEG